MVEGTVSTVNFPDGDDTIVDGGNTIVDGDDTIVDGCGSGHEPEASNNFLLTGGLR